MTKFYKSDLEIYQAHRRRLPTCTASKLMNALVCECDCCRVKSIYSSGEVQVRYGRLNLIHSLCFMMISITTVLHKSHQSIIHKINCSLHTNVLYIGANPVYVIHIRIKIYSRETIIKISEIPLFRFHFILSRLVSLKCLNQ